MDLSDDSELSSLSEAEGQQDKVKETARRSTARRGAGNNGGGSGDDDAGLPRRRQQRAPIAASKGKGKGKQAATRTSARARKDALNDSRGEGSDEENDDDNSQNEGGSGIDVDDELQRLLDEESDSISEDDEADEDFAGSSRGKRASTSKNSRKAAPGRAAVGKVKSRSATGAAARSKGRQRPKNTAAILEDLEDDEQRDGEQTAAARGKDDFRVEPDNALFNAIKDPRSAIEATVQDWIEQYQADEDSRGQALADLINMVLRSCGCNLSVDKHEAQDLDGVVSKLDDIQTEFSKVNQHFYPLTSKSKAYKPFRTSLSDFMRRLIDACSDSEILYDDIFCETLQSWLVASSSSKLRAFRHTSTAVALFLVEALCTVAKEVGQDFATLQRQKEAESRKTDKKNAGVTGNTKGTSRGAAAAAAPVDKAKLQELTQRIKTQHAKKMKLEEYFKDLFDGVFIHRYRDFDTGIRQECIKSLGVWMDTFEDYWLDGNYLRYIGWMLTDLHKDVRYEAVSALAALYHKDDYVNSLQHFTERFRSRLVEMALSDAETGVRVSALNVLFLIDKHGLLDDESQRDSIALSIFDAEARVRRASGEFMQTMWDELVDERKLQLKVGDYSTHNQGRKAQDEEQRMGMLRWKCLAALLVRLSQHLDKHEASQDGAEQTAAGERDHQAELRAGGVNGVLFRNKGAASAGHLASLLHGQSSSKDRISAAVESLWGQLEQLHDWKALLDYLLLDHSAPTADSGSGTTDLARKSLTGKERSSASERAQTENDQEEEENLPSARAVSKASRGTRVDETCRLEEQEETLLLAVLGASIRYTKYRATLLPKRDEEVRDEIMSTTTRALMGSLPRLFAKHQTDLTRSFLLLSLVEQLNLSFYLDMRQMTSYETLFEDVRKQFLKHTDYFILEQAMSAVRYLLSEETLSAPNVEQKVILESAVIQSLKLAVVDLDLINAGFLPADTLTVLTHSMVRIAYLTKSWETCTLCEETDPDTPNSVVDIAKEVLERGQLGLEEEAKLVQASTEVLYYHFLWKVVGLQPEDPMPESLIEFRDHLVTTTTNLALGRDNGAVEGVRRTAFKTMLDLRLACKGRFSGDEQDGVMEPLSIEAQYRCAGFVQAEIEKFSASLGRSRHDGEDGEEELIREREEENSESGGSDEDAQVGVNGASKKRKTGSEEDPDAAVSSRPRGLQAQAAEYEFSDLIASFCRAICADVINLHHSATVLAYYARLGPLYDECCKALAEALRFYGVQGNDAYTASEVVVESLKLALQLHLSSVRRSDAQFTALARLLSNHIVVRGKGFAVAQRLPSDELTKLHRDLISHTLTKVAELDSQEKATSKAKALVLFKALSLAVLGMTGKEAQIIHTHMDKTLKHNKLAPSLASKAWDGQRTYAKKLFSLMSKDGSIRAAAKKQASKAAPTDDELSGTEAEEAEGLPSRKRPRAKPANGTTSKRGKPADDVFKAPKPITLPTRRSGRVSTGVAGATAQYQEEDSHADEEAAEEQTSAPRYRVPSAQAAKAVGKAAAITQPTMDLDSEPDDSEFGSAAAGLDQEEDGDGDDMGGLPRRRPGKGDSDPKKRRRQESEIPAPSSPDVSAIEGGDDDLDVSGIPRSPGTLTGSSTSQAVPDTDLWPDKSPGSFGSLPPRQRDDDEDSLAHIPMSPPESSQMTDEASRAPKKRRIRR